MVLGFHPSTPCTFSSTAMNYTISIEIAHRTTPTQIKFRTNICQGS